jgi:plasmid maintenance system antidote protein VapI
MSVKEFAVLAHVPESLISAVINGRTSITLELANAIEKVTNIPSKFWIARQSNYDESLVKQRVEAKRESGVLKIAGTAV